MTICPPRASAPIASSGLSCDASSITTRSNLSWPGARYWATDSGPIMKHGLSATSALAERCISWRIGNMALLFVDFVRDQRHLGPGTHRAALVSVRNRALVDDCRNAFAVEPDGFLDPLLRTDAVVVPA